MWRLLALAGCTMLAFGSGIEPAGGAIPIALPVQFSHGRIIFTGSIGDKDSLRFLLDSACTIPTLHPKLVDELNLNPSGRVRINGIAGEERAPTYTGVVFDFNGVQYSPRRVASVPSERTERRRHDGVLDAGFFRRYVIELMPNEKFVRLYAATNFNYTGSGEIVPFHFREEIPVIEAALILGEGEPIKGEFEIDTGCDSALCVGESFVTKHDLLQQTKGRGSEKFGIGGSVRTRLGRVPVFRIGRTELRDVDAEFFLSGSPVDEPLAGHIGMEALGKKKVFFDYQRKRLIIE